MKRSDGTDDGEMDDSDDQQQQYKSTVTPYGIDRSKQQALEMHKLLKQFNEEFETEDQNTYYILSKNWFENWKQYVQYDEWVNEKQVVKNTTQISLQNYNKDLIIEYPANDCFKYYPLNSHPWNQWLKSDLVEGVDYIVINSAINNFLNKYYRGTSITRNSIGEGKNKKVVVNLLKFYAILMVPNTINQIAQDNLVQFEKEQLQVDENTTTNDYYQVILKTVPTFRGQYNNQNGVRLWRFTNQVDPHKQLFAEVKKQVQDLDFQDELVFNFSGDPIEISQTLTFKDLKITDKDIIIVEFQSLYKPWCVRHPSVPIEGRCEGCGTIAVLTVVCVCKKVSYCNEKCKVNDERFHLSKCDPYGSDDEQVKQMEIGDNSVKGIAGLANLGNTCFMNSGAQCLSNTYQLSEYFIQNKYFEEINLDNPLGTNGQLVRKYGSLIKKLWCGNKNVVIPTSFKKAVGQFQPMFKGFQQHDSSELITFLLDGLHEDLNRVKKKPYVETNDGQDKPDFEVAKESWQCHIARNQSIIVDMMHGQYKSTLKCPQCSKISITFDPFLTVGLAIPNKKVKQISIKVIKSVVSIDSKFLSFDGSKKQMPLQEFAKEFIYPEFKIDENSQVVYFSYFGQDAQDPFDSTAEINFVRKNSKKSGLTAKVLESWETKIEPANRIYLSFVQKALEGYGQQYKRTIQQASYLIIQKDFTLKQIHLAIFQTLIPIFCDLIQPNELNVENQDEVRQYYEEKIFDKYYSVQYKSNSMYWRACGYCGNKNCNECPTPYSDDTYETVKTKAQENDATLKFELVIFWNQSPFQHIKPADIYSYHQNQQAKKQMEEENNNNNNNNTDENNNKGRFVQKTNCYQIMQPQKVTLQECLKYSEQPEELAEDNTWFCKNCKDHVRAFKSMQIYKAADILIFSLKRFKASHGIFKQKLETFVEFPVRGLDLTEFIINKNKPSDYDKEQTQQNQIEVEQNQPLIYDLYAVSNHFGGMGGGHYTAFAKNQLNGKWYNFDDGHVTEMDEENVISKSAYVLFYKRRTQMETENTQPLISSQEN